VEATSTNTTLEDHDLRLLLSTLIRIKRSGANCTLKVETLDGKARASLNLGPRSSTTPSLEPGNPGSIGAGHTVPPLFPHPCPSHPRHPPFPPREGGPGHPRRRRGPSARRRDALRRQAWLASRQAPAPPAGSSPTLQAAATVAPLPAQASLVLPSQPTPSSLSSSLPNLAPSSTPNNEEHTTHLPSSNLDPRVTPTITITPPYKLATSSPSLTTVGLERRKRPRKPATVLHLPLHLQDSAIQQLDGEGEGKEEGEKKEEEKEDTEKNMLSSQMESIMRMMEEAQTERAEINTLLSS